MKNKALFTVLPGILFLALTACDAEKNEQKIVFMDNFKVFEEFKLKKEYDSLLFLDQEKFKKQLDSLSVVIQSKSGSAASQAQSDMLKKDYVLLHQQLSEQLQTKSAEYTGIVYERLNSYVKQYGKEQGYAFILGSDGKGNVMYVDSTMDVTKDLLNYVNKKYEDE